MMAGRVYVILLTTCATVMGFNVSVDVTIERRIQGVSISDRQKWINIHSSPANPPDWRPADITEFEGYGANLGRSFVFSSMMAISEEDSTRPGFVNKTKLIEQCKNNPKQFLGWQETEVDLVHSSKTAQLYANGCGQPPKGFVPGSHAATAEFFQTYFENCMWPTTLDRYIIEVANECNVKVERCNTSWAEMIAVHIAVADALHNASSGGPQKALVCGPTAAYPEYEIGGFENWRDIMGEFIAVAGKSVDCVSVHYYDTFVGGEDYGEFATSTRTGNNLDALLDLQESFSFFSFGHVLPLLVSEYGTGFKEDELKYAPLNDWRTLRGVMGKLMQFMDRADRLLKAIPFIVDKATWNPNTLQNSTYSYPWVMWRYVNNSWQETHLVKFYQFWEGVMQNASVKACLSYKDLLDANIQVQCFAGTSEVHVIINNLDKYPKSGNLVIKNLQHLFGVNVAVNMTTTITRLYYDSDAQVPVLQKSVQDSYPTYIPLTPFEAMRISVTLPQEQANVKADVATKQPSLFLSTVSERTYYEMNNKMLVNISEGNPGLFQFNVNNSSNTIMYSELRLGLSASYDDMIALLEPDNLANNMTVTVIAANQTLAFDRSNLGGGLHIDTKDDTVFGALKFYNNINFPSQITPTSTQIQVSVQGKATLIISSAVLMLGEKLE
eukprot:m.82080 g.82080  ORF g.82080 m.82080 type:complete len:667 (+) comp12851_c0_seq4:150-2150(+)